MTPPRPSPPGAPLRRLALLVWLGVAIGFGAEPERKIYTLPAGDATVTLRRYSEQSGEQLVFPPDRVRGVQTNAVRGELTARAALERMLAGTELRIIEDPQTGALAVGRTPPPPRVPAARAPKTAAPAPEDLVRLNPFEVHADPAQSYGALEANSVTAFRLPLEKIPATTMAFTQTFMDDVASSSIQDMLVNYAGTVGADPNNAGAALMMPGDRDGSGGGLGIRGLAVGPPKRDGFIGMRTVTRSAIGYTDNFTTERIEVIEGPQSLLYGAVGGGGVVNLVSKRASFGGERGTVQTRFDQYGGKRVMADYNAGTSRFAVRVAAVGEQRRNVRYNLGNDFYGLYAQAALRLGEGTTLRIFGERNSNWGNVAFTPGAGDLNNFLAATDPRRGQDPRYLALTGQLRDLDGKLWAGAADYNHLSSFGAWWSSERIEGKFSGVTLESVLGRGFSAQVSAIYSETIDDRFTVSKNLVPGAGLAGAGANPFAGTAVRFTPSDNWQSDRTKGVRATLLYETDVPLGKFRGRSQTALGVEGNHQGPAFASSGIDRLYYQADANWNPVVSPALTTDYGRVPLGSLYFPIQGGIPLRPVFAPGTRRVTLNGQNYVLEPRIRQDPARVAADNPVGLVPNNPTATNPNGFSGQWNRGAETHDRQWYLANFTDWADGRLTTLAGVSVDRFTSLNANVGVGPTYLAPRNYVGYSAGLSYRLDPLAGLRAYATMSTAGLAAGTTKDFYGNPLRVPHARSAWPEVGLKYDQPGRKFAAQLAFNPATRVVDEARNVGSDFFNAVNPNGINGRYNLGDQWINVNRAARSLELLLTASPTKSWRLRLDAVWLDGEITNTVAYRQLYNDQFFASGGTVTYRDGTPLLVDPTATGGERTTPLTLAMINDPAGTYYATPDANSGRLTNPALIAALTAVDPVHGRAATGVTGLPISAIQYAFDNPHRGEVTVVEAGDKTTGISEYSLNFQCAHSFAEGAWRGLGLFADVRTAFRNRAYYTSYFPTAATGNAVQATRALYRLPTATVVGLGLSYERRLWGRTWTTRLNVNNALNHDRVWVVPSNANGAILNARLSAQPRQFVWTTTVNW